MGAPLASRSLALGQHLAGILFLGLALSHCTTRPTQTDGSAGQTPAPPEWYLAQRDPLTYCPKGHTLPPPRHAYGPAPVYVYLADRTTRFYIPTGATRHQLQALELRRLSQSQTHGLSTTTPTVDGTMRWVRRALARTAVTSLTLTAALFAGPPDEGSIADAAMEAVWEDED